MTREKFDRKVYQETLSTRLANLADSENAQTVTFLGIQIHQENWLVALDELEEVLPVTDITWVPHTQTWLKGMVNVRGNLYTLTDLANYKGHPSGKISIESRILLVHSKFGVNAGLLVDKLLGLRNLNQLQVSADTGLTAANHAQYHDSEQQLWSVLSIQQLLDDSRFMQVAMFR